MKNNDSNKPNTSAAFNCSGLLSLTSCATSAAGLRRVVQTTLASGTSASTANTGQRPASSDRFTTAISAATRGAIIAAASAIPAPNKLR